MWSSPLVPQQTHAPSWEHSQAWKPSQNAREEGGEGEGLSGGPLFGKVPAPLQNLGQAAACLGEGGQVLASPFSGIQHPGWCPISPHPPTAGELDGPTAARTADRTGSWEAAGGWGRGRCRLRAKRPECGRPVLRPTPFLGWTGCSKAFQTLAKRCRKGAAPSFKHTHTHTFPPQKKTTPACATQNPLLAATEILTQKATFLCPSKQQLLPHAEHTHTHTQPEPIRSAGWGIL